VGLEPWASAAPDSPLAGPASRSHRRQGRCPAVGRTRTNGSGRWRSSGLAAAGSWAPHAHAGRGASAPSRPRRRRRSGVRPSPRSARGRPRRGPPHEEAHPGTARRVPAAPPPRPPPARPSTRWCPSPRG